MNSDIDTKTITSIVARIKAASGAPVNEDHLHTILSNSLTELKTKDPAKYLEVLQDLSNKLEDMAAKIGHLQVQK